MLTVFRRLERQERFFKLLQEFGQLGRFFLRHDARAGPRMAVLEGEFVGFN